MTFENHRFKRLKNHIISIYDTIFSKYNKYEPTPALLPGESHGQRSPVCPQGHKESEMTEVTWHVGTCNKYAYIHMNTYI